MTLIPEEILRDILARAAASPGAEVCGLLFGSLKAITHVEHVANVSPTPRESFEVDPTRLIAALRAERGGGPSLVGHYHSHPNGSPAPSPRDQAAAEPGKLWLIVGGGQARLWLAENDGFSPRPLVRG